MFLGALGLLALGFPLLALAAEPQASAPDRSGAAGDGYVVKKGDSLWGIAKDLYDDPILWPRIWERNPFIANPNRIFPGDTLTLPGTMAVPAPAPPKVEPPKVEPPVAKAPEPPPAPAPAPAPAPVAPPPPPLSPLGEHALACAPIALEEGALAGMATGKILRTENAQLLISQQDTVFVGLTGAQFFAPGDRLAVLRTAHRLSHPSTRKPLGQVVLSMGILEVLEVSGLTLKTRVSYSCDEMRLGDSVVAYALPDYPVGKETAPATRGLQGTVVGSMNRFQLFAQQQVVFADLGAAQGIAPGDVVAVSRPVPPIDGRSVAAGQVYAISPDRLGEGVVVRIGPQVATVLLMSTARETMVGDAVELSRQITP
ncbi:MAG: LysM peptidoglycan-binding domain-containing protein [Candidatus Methylomirabilota bacterium]